MTFMSGCLFKAHEPDGIPGFIELIYQVTRPEFERKGLGSRIIQELKKYANYMNDKEFKVMYIVTYADNNAVKFFEKQGFF